MKGMGLILCALLCGCATRPAWERIGKAEFRCGDYAHAWRRKAWDWGLEAGIVIYDPDWTEDGKTHAICWTETARGKIFCGASDGEAD